MRIPTVGKKSLALASVAALAWLVVGCAAPAPTATPTQPPVAALTPTKAPAATPTKRPVQKASIIFPTIATVYGLHWLAEANNYLLEEGLDLDLTVSGAGAKALAAASSGDVDIAILSGLDVISAIASGAPVQAFLSLEKRQRSYVVLRKDVADRLGITEKASYEEKARLVKGLTFAASSPNSGSDLRTRFFLRNGGLDPDRDVTMTYIGLPAIPAALEQGSVDGSGIDDPDASLLVSKGTIVVLVNYAEGKMAGTESQVSGIGIARKENMQKRPDIYEAYVRAIWRAMDFMQAKSDEGWEIVRKARFTDLDPEVYRLGVKGGLPAISYTPEMTKAMFDGGVNFVAKALNQPPAKVSYEDYYTDRFVQAAKKQLGK